MSRFQTFYYRPKPGASPAPAGAAFRGRPQGDRTRPPAAIDRARDLGMRMHGGKSKKGYTGTRAGLGRVSTPTPATGPIYRQGPKGPAGARFFAAKLPRRSQTRATPPPATNKRPGLINRLFRRMRGA